MSDRLSEYCACDDELARDIEKNMDEYVAVGFRLDRCLMKPFKKKEITPEELAQIGKFLSDKWQKEVVDKVDDIIIDFMRENEAQMVGQIDTSYASVVEAIVMENSLIGLVVSKSMERGE